MKYQFSPPPSITAWMGAFKPPAPAALPRTGTNLSRPNPPSRTQNPHRAGRLHCEPNPKTDRNDAGFCRRRLEAEMQVSCPGNVQNFPGGNGREIAVSLFLRGSRGYRSCRRNLLKIQCECSRPAQNRRILCGFLNNRCSRRACSFSTEFSTGQKRPKYRVFGSPTRRKALFVGWLGTPWCAAPHLARPRPISPPKEAASGFMYWPQTLAQGFRHSCPDQHAIIFEALG
jgi:hypothetical protein